MSLAYTSLEIGGGAVSMIVILVVLGVCFVWTSSFSQPCGLMQVQLHFYSGCSASFGQSEIWSFGPLPIILRHYYQHY